MNLFFFYFNRTHKGLFWNCDHNFTRHTEIKIHVHSREVLLDVIQHGLTRPVDLLMVLSERLLGVERPGQRVLLRPLSLHVAATGLLVPLYVALRPGNHIKLGSCLAFEHVLSKTSVGTTKVQTLQCRQTRVRTCTVFHLMCQAGFEFRNNREFLFPRISTSTHFNCL